MASNLYIEEFTTFAISGEIAEAVNVAPSYSPYLAATQQVAIGGSSAQSSAFGATTLFIRVNASAACSLLFGSNPTAAATAQRLPANVDRYYAVIPGQKLAVITNTDT